MSKKLCLVSLKFSPGLLKEIICLGDCFEKHDLDVSIHLDMNYKNLFGPMNLSKTRMSFFNGGLSNFIALIGAVCSKSTKGIIFYNSHPLNLLLLLCLILRNRKALRVLVLHEPLKTNKIKNFGFSSLKVLAVELINKLQSWLCSDLIILSKYGIHLVESAHGYNPYAVTHEARILLDPLPQFWQKNQRKYLSFIGNVNGTKGINSFYNLAKFCGKDGQDFRFALITGSTLSKYDRSIYDLDNVEVIEKSPLTDLEIEDWMTQSIAVFCLHRSVTQSGVLVECMRTGTPVICIDESGFTQFIKDVKCLVPTDYDNSDLISAIDHVSNNLLDLSQKALKQFSDEFSSERFIDYYCGLLNRMGIKS